jgi:hypothetical protein
MREHNLEVSLQGLKKKEFRYFGSFIFEELMISLKGIEVYMEKICVLEINCKVCKLIMV